jgi:hypothetical protein
MDAARIVPTILKLVSLTTSRAANSTSVAAIRQCTSPKDTFEYFKWVSKEVSPNGTLNWFSGYWNALKLKHSFAKVSKLLPNHWNAFVVRQGQRIVGGFDIVPLGPKMGMINAFAIDKAFRGDKLSLELFNFLKKHATERGFENLVFFTTNPKLKHAASRYGFRPEPNSPLLRLQLPHQ